MKIAGRKLRIRLCAGGSAYAQATGSQVETFATSVQSLIGFLQQTAGSTDFLANMTRNRHVLRALS